MLESVTWQVSLAIGTCDLHPHVLLKTDVVIIPLKLTGHSTKICRQLKKNNTKNNASILISTSQAGAKGVNKGVELHFL